MADFLKVLISNIQILFHFAIAWEVLKWIRFSMQPTNGNLLLKGFMIGPILPPIWKDFIICYQTPTVPVNVKQVL